MLQNMNVAISVLWGITTILRGVNAVPAQAEVRTRVVVVEDEDLYREMLVSILSLRPQLEVVGSFASGADALAQIPALRPDVVLMDIVLGGGMNGIQVGLKLRQALPRLGIALLSNHLKPSILRSIPENAMLGWAYLHKAAVKSIAVIERAIAGTADGMVVLDPGIIASASRTQRAPVDLTPRQVDVLHLMAQGYSNEGIAEGLGLTEKTVSNYINNIYQRLTIDGDNPQMQPRIKAVLYYLNELADEPIDGKI